MNSGIVDVSSAFSEWGSVFNSSGILVADSIDKVVAATDNVAKEVSINGAWDLCVILTFQRSNQGICTIYWDNGEWYQCYE